MNRLDILSLVPLKVYGSFACRTRNSKFIPFRCSSLLLSVLALLSSASVHGLEIDIGLSTGGTAAVTNIYGTTVVSGSVTNWGSHFKDYVFMLKSGTGSNIVIDSFAITVTANPGITGTPNLNVTWFNWVDSNSQTNPDYASRLGTATAPPGSFNGFSDTLMGPATFSPTSIAATPAGSKYFFRVWDAGAGQSTGYSVKLVPNTDLVFAISNAGVSMYNYDGATFSTTPATNYIPVPEPSTYLLAAVSAVIFAWTARKRSCLQL